MAEVRRYCVRANTEITAPVSASVMPGTVRAYTHLRPSRVGMDGRDEPGHDALIGGRHPPPPQPRTPLPSWGLRVGRAVWRNARKLGSAPGKSTLTRATGTRTAPQSSRGGKNLLSAGYGRTRDL